MPKKISNMNFNDYKPLREVIFNTLREAIIVGELKPGERLMEVKLADKMGVSRTPIREAIRKLELEGLVDMIPRKGAHVADLSRKDIMNVLEVRASLDGLATSLAAKRITDTELEELKQIQAQFISNVDKGNLNALIKKDVEFHEVIYRASRNEKLMQISNNLREQVQRFRVIYMKDYVRPKELIREHEEILHAIEGKDYDFAMKSAIKHIQKQEDAIINALDQNNL